MVSHGPGWFGVGISTGCLPPVCLLPFTAHPFVVTLYRHHHCRRRRRHHPPAPSTPQSTSRVAARTTTADIHAVISPLVVFAIVMTCNDQYCHAKICGIPWGWFVTICHGVCDEASERYTAIYNISNISQRIFPCLRYVYNICDIFSLL